MVTHFQLVQALGDELGRPDWPPRSVIYRGGDELNLRVVDLIAGDGPELFDVLVADDDLLRPADRSPRAENRQVEHASTSASGNENVFIELNCGGTVIRLG